MITYIPNSDHWTRRNLVAWWPNLPGLSYGTTLWDVTGNYNYAITAVAGTDSRPGGPWSANIRPGSLGNASVGPFTWSSTTYYGNSSLALNTVCPTAGTVALWICPGEAYNSGTNSFALAQEALSDATLRQFCFFHLSNNNIYFGFYNNSLGDANRVITAATSTNWPLGKWVHYALTFAVGDNVRLYINGVPSGTSSGTISSMPVVTGTGLQLGRNAHDNTNYWTGAIDDLSVWSYQMTASRVMQAYNDSLAGWPNRIDFRTIPDQFYFGYTVPFDGNIYLGAPGATATAGTNVAELDTLLTSSPETTATCGTVTTSGGYSLLTSSVGSLINHDHWANQDLAAWWGVVPGLAYGNQVYNIAGDPSRNFTIVNRSGSDSRPGGPWSQNINPGALGNASYGPFTWGATPTNYYGASNLDINTLCPKAGTIALWHCPLVMIGGNAPILSQGNLYSGPYFSIRYVGTTFESGFMLSGTSYEAGYTVGNQIPNKWTHYAITFAAGDYVRLYIDGVYKAISPALPSVIGSVGTPLLTLGCAYDGFVTTLSDFLNSSLDDINIWSRQMSSSEVGKLYSESRNGWPNRLANWQVPDRFGIAPYDIGVSIVLAAPLATSSYASIGAELDVLLSGTTGTTDCGGATEAIQPPLEALSAIGALGVYTTEIDILLDGTTSTTDVGGFIPPGWVYLQLVASGSDSTVGGNNVELDIILSGFGADGAVGFLAGSWDTTIIFLSSATSDALPGTKIAELDVAAHGPFATGGRGTFTIFEGSIILLASVGATVNPATTPSTDVSVLRTTATGSTAKLGRINSAPSPSFSAPVSSIGIGGCSQTAAMVLHGPVVTVIPGHVPFGPWVILAAPEAAATIGQGTQGITVRKAALSALGRSGHSPAGPTVSTTAPSADISPGFAGGSPTMRLSAARSNSTPGNRRAAVTVLLDSTTADVDPSAQTQSVLIPAHAAPIPASLGRWSSRLIVSVAALDVAVDSGVATGVSSPRISAPESLGKSGGRRASVTIPLAGLGSDISLGNQSPAIVSAINAAFVAAKLGSSPRSIAVGLSGQSSDAILGGNLLSLILVCTAGRATATKGVGLAQTDPISLSVVGPGVMASSGSRTTTAIIHVASSQAKVATGLARPRIFISLASSVATSALGQSGTSIRIAVPATSISSTQGAMLVSSPPVELDVIAPGSGVDPSGCVAAVSMSILAPWSDSGVGIESETTTILLGGATSNSVSAHMGSAIMPYAYPDPFQAIDLEEVDPFEATSQARN